MTSRTVRAVIVFIALVSAGASLAEDGSDFGEPGYYAVFQVGGVFFREEAIVDGVTTGVILPPVLITRRVVLSAPTQVSYGVRIGHRWEHFGLEIDGDYVGGKGVVEPKRIPPITGTYPGQKDDPRTPMPEGEVRSFNVSLSAKLYPWTRRVQPYLAGGLGMSHISPSPTGLQGQTLFGGAAFSLRVGGGVEVYLTRHLFLDASVTYYFLTGPSNRAIGGDQSYLAVRSGLGWRFF